MQNLRMYMCDTCGFAAATPDLCPFCNIPLTEYTKETQREYQVDMEEPMRTVDPLRWYL